MASRESALGTLKFEKSKASGIDAELPACVCRAHNSVLVLDALWATCSGLWICPTRPEYETLERLVSCLKMPEKYCSSAL